MQTYFFIWSQKLEKDSLENTMHYDQKDAMWGSFAVKDLIIIYMAERYYQILYGEILLFKVLIITYMAERYYVLRMFDQNL